MYNCIYIKEKQSKLILEVRIVVTSGEEEESVEIGAKGELLGCS